MNSIANNNIEIITYDLSNPIDEAYSIMNWLDNIEPSKIVEVITEFRDRSYITEYGKEVVAYVELFSCNIATNKGIGKTNLDRYEKFRKWCKKHKIYYHPDIDKAIRNNKRYKNGTSK